jgi:hypothetical protein
MNCEFQSPRNKNGFYCSIGRYRGTPHAIACQKCIVDGRNFNSREVPSIADQVANFFGAARRHVRSGLQVTPTDILADREALCRACEWWDDSALKGTGRCKKCGCSTWAKLRIATERCPIGKWEPHLTSQPN